MINYDVILMFTGTKKVSVSASDTEEAEMKAENMLMEEMESKKVKIDITLTDAEVVPNCEAYTDQDELRDREGKWER